jgi:7,8-dihydropterin-6-yl-methyl-4-(beta-D-ribofuranosyl)aminobenzene 5'-phosphate synthase
MFMQQNKWRYIKIHFFIILQLLCSISFGGEHMKQEKVSQFPQDLKFTVVFDNNPCITELQTAWGFACVITGLDETILFDTGADGYILLKNMEKLHIKPETIQTIVLSHEHWDHVGGLELFLQKNPHVKIYLLKSFPEEIKSKARSQGAQVIEVDQSMQICPHVHSSGEIVAAINEQVLIIRSDRGLIIMAGCAHPDIVSIVEKVKTLFADDILLVLGGWHLGNKSNQELSSVLNHFRRLNVRYVAPTHCTGQVARGIFARDYNEYFLDIGLGRVIKYSEIK